MLCALALAPATAHDLATLDSPTQNNGGYAYLQNLGRKSDGTLDTQLLALGSLKELRADLLERSDFSASKGDPNLVDFLLHNISALIRSSHTVVCSSRAHEDGEAHAQCAAYRSLTEILLWFLERRHSDSR